VAARPGLLKRLDHRVTLKRGRNERPLIGKRLFLEKVDADEHHRLAALIFRPMLDDGNEVGNTIHLDAVATMMTMR
jgi:hypothetical protein